MIDVLDVCELLECGWAHVDRYCEALQARVDDDGRQRLSKIQRLFRQIAAIHNTAELLTTSPVPATRELAAQVGALTALLGTMKWRTTTSTRRRLRLPDSDAVARILSHLLYGTPAVDMSIDRQLNPSGSTFPSEVITCSLGPRSVRKVLCKYQTLRDADALGLRRGPAYEAMVYERMVAPLDVPAPGYLGKHVDENGRTWLFIDFLPSAIRLDALDAPEEGLVQAAQWLGRYQRRAMTFLAETDASFLNRYDGAYYAGWAQRTLECSGLFGQRLAWLSPLCRRAADELIALADVPPTVVHGEFTPHNLLFSAGQLRVVDWESAAIACGEIDLAALTEGWPPQITEACEQAYVEARWPADAAAVAPFAARMKLARLFWTLRWLGDRADWPPTPAIEKRLRRLRALGDELGLVS